MSDSQQFKLPDVGEGLTEAEITNWYVQVGDSVDVNDTIVEIETAKSAVELPSPYAGVVEQILAEAGDTVPVGTPIVVIGSGKATEPFDEDKPQVLVGPGPKEAAARRRRLGSARADVVTASAVPVTEPPAAPVAATNGAAVGRQRGASNLARTTPPVRLIARDLGVDLEELAQTTSAIITRDDVELAASGGNGDRGEHGNFPVKDTATQGVREKRIPIKGVRKLTAEAMSRSAFTAPHVTEWLTVDVTPTIELLAAVKADPAWEGVRVNPLVLVARAFLLAIRAYPDINASWDETNNEIVLKHYVNLGIAAATPRGLIVPNIKDAHTLDTRALATALAELVSVARSGKTPPEDMAHGTVTITNIGALGVDAGTPILNPGESAILAFGAIRQQPWVVNGQIEIRQVTQLAMSFDHRLVDGELGSHVLARTGAILADPSTALLYS